MEQWHQCDRAALPGITPICLHPRRLSVHTGTLSRGYLSCFLGRAHASHPSAHILCRSFLAQTCCSLPADVCLHPFICVSDKLPSSSLSPITLDALSSPALQLHSKEHGKITSHFLSFPCSFLPWFFWGAFFPFFPSGTVPFRKCLEAENFADTRALRRLVKGAGGVWGEQQSPGQWEP